MASGIGINEMSSVLFKTVKKTSTLSTADQYAEWIAANVFDQKDSRAHLVAMIKQALQHYKGDI